MALNNEYAKKIPDRFGEIGNTEYCEVTDFRRGVTVVVVVVVPAISVEPQLGYYKFHTSYLSLF